MEVHLDNPLGYKDTKHLIREYAVPSIISLLVGALYNIVDQIFIGQGVGLYGNAATNVAFPLNSLALAISLLIGVGAAAVYNLYLGQGNKKKAKDIAQNMLVSVITVGIILMIFTLLFLDQLLDAFGATEVIMDLSRTYMGIIAYGMPFFMFSTAFSHTIRADGSPRFGMMINLAGALLNTILDPIFIFVFNWGIAGAAYATIISQMFGAVLSLSYIKRMRYVKIDFKNFKPDIGALKEIALFGLSPFVTQGAAMLFQMILNNTLKYYGALSPYGSEVPLAVVGVISKVNFIYLSFVLGIAQSAQLIAGYNYGAKQYERSKKVLREGLIINFIISGVFFGIFQIFPNQILSLFGDGGELYFEFGRQYFRIFLFTTFLNGVQPVTAQYLTAIGKPKRGTVISLTRQVLFLIPLVYLLPKIWGINGVLYAGPIADTSAVVAASILIKIELDHMKELQEIRDSEL